MKSERPDALRLIVALLPSLITLLGVGAIRGGAIADNEGYRWLATTLLFSAGISILIALVVATYPFLHERPFSLIGTTVVERRTAKRRREGFERWAKMWRDYSVFLLNHMKKGATMETWIAAQPDYQRYRERLIALEDGWQRPAAAFALHQADLVWEQHRTKLDARLGQGSFFGLYREEEFDRLMVGMIVDMAEGVYGSGGHHMRQTISGVWDALSRYSVAQGWGPLGLLPVAEQGAEDE